MSVFFYTSIVIVALYLLVMLVFIIAWLMHPVFHYKNESNITKTVIIIPARNEEKNIANCLQDIINQTFNKNLLEVIVVDDYSTDNTAEIARSISKQHSFVKLISSEAPSSTRSFKKFAIAQAIKNTKSELIITTDADCRMRENWLSKMVSYYEKHKPKMIAGPVCMEAGNSVFEKFQSIEFSALTFITASAIFIKKPVMCNGANLAYTREAFEKVNGFEQVNTIASGDDVLLMNKINKKFPGGVHFIKNNDAIVKTMALSSYKEFINQRTRWASKTFLKGNYFNSLLALLVYLFNITLLLGSTIAIIGINTCILSSPFWCLSSFIISAFIINFLLLFLGLSFLGLKKYWWIVFPEQPLYSIYIVIMGLRSLVYKRYTWKERKQLI